MFELIPFARHMTTVDPFAAFDDMERSFFNGSAVSAFRTDVVDTGDSFLLEAELPGFKKEDISLDVENDCLTISAKREHSTDENKPNFVKRERFYGSFSRCFDVSGINVDAIEAEYTDGVLKLTMPKKVETVPPTRKLSIK